MSKTSAVKLPDWVMKYKTKGKVVKSNGDHYYLYRHTSKYVPGKKYPQSVDIYIGTITPDGLVPAKKHKVAGNAPMVVREFGYTTVLMQLCPDEWKQLNGKDWKERLRSLIVSKSPNSYLIDEETPIKSCTELNFNAGAQYTNLIRRMNVKYGVTRKELEQLRFIYRVVEFQGDDKDTHRKKYRVTLSRIDEKQQIILDKLHFQMEVS